ncbi:MAG: hypothetical protein ACLFS3_01395 [Candidatus Aenigmatarchaeota archaeon]
MKGIYLNSETGFKEGESNVERYEMFSWSGDRDFLLFLADEEVEELKDQGEIQGDIYGGNLYQDWQKNWTTASNLKQRT